MSDAVYNPVQAKLEASRCLMCEEAPCVCNCPAGVDARGFIRKIRFDDLDGAVRLLKRCNVLAASCAYICPTGGMCGKECSAEGLVHPIDIKGLQKFVCEYERGVGMIEPIRSRRDGAKIAVVGAGPAGLGCAAELAVKHHAVTVFERDGKAGGMLAQCIPSWRLPAEVVAFEQEFIEKLGVEFSFNSEVSDPASLLKQGFDAVFVSIGLDKPKGMDVIGSKLDGVYQALPFLSEAKRGRVKDLGKRVIVIGGGDTALDAARVARRAGSQVIVLYRRTQGEMPAYPEEVDGAWDEGVEFYFRTIVHGVVGKGKVAGVRCVRVRWHGRTRGMAQGYDVEGPEFQIACDAVVMAVGQGPSTAFGLRQTPSGFIAIDSASAMTSTPGVFAGGDCAIGGGTAARATGHGRMAALKIEEYLTSKS
jgi:glutamate synthase (NADPH/NADH) small chain